MEIEYVQSLLTRSEIEQLLKKSGARSKKDALRVAVKHYLKCESDAEGD